MEFDTANYPEQQRGMFVCGINWGGSSDVTRNNPGRDRYYRSFFSDTSNEWVMNSGKYRSRVLSWLKLLGLDLETNPQRIGRLEKSISQSNWLSTQSVNTHEQNNIVECTENNDFFFAHLSAINPSLVFFLSVDLLHALNADACLSKAQDILGQADQPQFHTRNLILNGKQHPCLTVGMQFFRKATVIALPHPAYGGGIADEYIASFSEWIGNELRLYMTAQREDRAYR